MTEEETMETTNYFEFGGNQQGRWLDCKNCGVRLGYWPKRGHSGKYRTQVHPEVIWEAFIRLQNKEIAVEKKSVQASITAVEADLKLHAQQLQQKKKEESRSSQDRPDSNHHPDRSARTKGYFKFAGDLSGTRSRSSDDSSTELVADGEMDAESTVRAEVAQMEEMIVQLRRQLERQGVELEKRSSERSKSKTTSLTPRSGRSSSSRTRRVAFSKTAVRTKSPARTSSPPRSKSPGPSSGPDSATDASWEKAVVTGEQRED